MNDTRRGRSRPSTPSTVPTAEAAAPAAVQKPVAADTAAPETAQHDIRWMGRFRRIEHRRDPVYQDTAVSVCGCVITVAAENLRLLRCRACFPPGVAP